MKEKEINKFLKVFQGPNVGLVMTSCFYTPQQQLGCQSVYCADIDKQTKE